MTKHVEEKNPDHCLIIVSPCLSVYLSACLSACLSLSLALSRYVRLSPSPFVSLSISLFFFYLLHLLLHCHVSPLLRQTGLEASSTIRALGFTGLIVGLTGNALDDDVANFLAAGTYVYFADIDAIGISIFFIVLIRFGFFFLFSH